MKDTEKELLPQLQRYRFAPGDRLVITIPAHITAEQHQSLNALLSGWLPAGSHPPLILAGGATLGICSFDQASGDDLSPTP